MITAREVFDLTTACPPVRMLAARAGRELRPGACLRMLRAYYRDPLAWWGALVSLLVLAYAGGAVMFLLHAVILGEQGPAILMHTRVPPRRTRRDV